MRPTCPHCNARLVRYGGSSCYECLDKQMRQLHEPEQQRQAADRDHKGKYSRTASVVSPRAMR